MVGNRPRPYIIWVQDLRDTMLMLLVYKPTHQRFLKWGKRWKKVTQVHVQGPILYRSNRERMEYLEEMIDVGKEHVPPDTPYRVAVSLADVQEIIKKSLRP